MPADSIAVPRPHQRPGWERCTAVRQDANSWGSEVKGRKKFFVLFCKFWGEGEKLKILLKNFKRNGLLVLPLEFWIQVWAVRVLRMCTSNQAPATAASSLKGEHSFLHPPTHPSIHPSLHGSPVLCLANPSLSPGSGVSCASKRPLTLRKALLSAQAPSEGALCAVRTLFTGCLSVVILWGLGESNRAESQFLRVPCMPPPSSKPQVTKGLMWGGGGQGPEERGAALAPEPERRGANTLRAPTASHGASPGPGTSSCHHRARSAPCLEPGSTHVSPSTCTWDWGDLLVPLCGSRAHE